jgi:hypothetical protein
MMCDLTQQIRSDLAKLATHMEHLRADVGALVTDVHDSRSIVTDTRIDLAR